MGSHYKHLGLSDRVEIYRMHELGDSLQSIADHVGFHKSSISRELRRNSIKTKSWPGGYHPVRADGLCQRRRRWDGRFKLARQPDLRACVMQRLAMGWSPEQIAGRLALEKVSSTISHEAIYRFIYHRVTQKDYLNRLLPLAKSRRGKLGQRGGNPKDLIKHRVSIADRPDRINTRQRFGDWENDGMAFRRNSQYILISHERKSRLVTAVRQPDKTATATALNLLDLFSALPASLRRSTTFDNGSEFYAHWTLNQQFGMATYFCDTHSPWQKGGIENAISRIRRYLPSNANPNDLSDHDFNAIFANYNATPRKCLAFKTPAELFNKKLQSLHFNRESTSPLSRE